MIKKMLKKIVFLFIICITTVMTIISIDFSVNVNAKVSEDKVYSNASIDDDFTDNRVIIVLNDAASKINKEYTTNDFNGIDCIRVIELNENIDNQIDKFNKVLCLEFSFNSKHQVLETIDVLMSRSDIYYAGHDYNIKIDSISYNDSFKNLQ